MKTYYTIYKITNTINDKIYIGMHQTKNLDDGYYGSGKLIKRAIEKHGIENFTKEYISICNDKAEMINLEKELVNEEFVERDDTYNIGLGGYGWNTLNDGSSSHLERCKKAAKKSRESYRYKLKHDIAYRQKVSQRQSKITKLSWKLGKFDHVNHATFKGKHHTEETKRKISNANKINMLGGKNPMFGEMWISNIELKISKHIPNLEEIPTGWVKGRNKWKDISKKEKQRKKLSIIEENKKQYYIDLFNTFMKSDYDSIREFCRLGYYDKTNQSLSRYFRRYVPDYHNLIKSRTGKI